MLLTMQRAQLHCFTVTQTQLNNAESLMLDQEVLELAGILPYERVEVVNCNNGERFVTNVVATGRGSGICSLNGPAARKAQPGDLISVTAFALLSPSEAIDLLPTFVSADEHNRPTLRVDPTADHLWSAIMEIEGY